MNDEFKEGQKVKCVMKFDIKACTGELEDIELGKVYTIRCAINYPKHTKLFLEKTIGSFSSIMFQPVGFDNIILSKYDTMPVTLLLDNRHRNITDEQFEDIKVYIRKIINVTRVDNEIYVCVKCRITGSKHDIITHKCKEK